MPGASFWGDSMVEQPVTAFPLTWPEGLPRTERKAHSQFRTSLSVALKNVKKSLEDFGRDSGKAVTDIILSSNVGGLDLSPPKDSGVAAWFTWDGGQRCIAVDRYPKPEDNLQAIHHILEARRTEMRHGGLHIVRQTFKGFTALPAPKGAKYWREVLGIEGPATREKIDAAYRERAKAAHPDRGGSTDMMSELNLAKRTALAALGGE
jgi:hypothetical protein